MSPPSQVPPTDDARTSNPGPARADDEPLTKARAVRLLQRYGQEHVLRWWDQLPRGGRRRLLEQLRDMDVGLVGELVDSLLRGQPEAEDLQALGPAPAVSPAGLTGSERQRLVALGEAALAEGRVAVLTVAGGLGTRLGAGPVKGQVAVGPVSGKSLFQLQAETILALSRKHGRQLHWFVMTSGANDQATRDYLWGKGFFGLPGEAVHVFRQGRMPVVDERGKLLLDAPDHVAESPDGHGGCLYALSRSGALSEMGRLGVELIYYHQVDNALAGIAEALFLGLHLDRGAQASSKALVKRDAGEGLGLFALDRRGRLRVVEYSDMPRELQEGRDGEGRLRFRLGSIAIHVFSRDFFEGLIDEGVRLPFHRAHKKVAYLNDAGQVVTPEEPNAHKFEMFVFDVLGWAERALVVETTRGEFSPVKEPTGPDSPAAARAALARRYADWLEAAGVPVERTPEGEPTEPVEVSPLVALSAQELAQALAPGARLEHPIYLEETRRGR